MVWNFGDLSPPVYGDRGYTEWLPKVGGFLETFLSEGANFFYMVYINVN